jgi:hypothetical protein
LNYMNLQNKKPTFSMQSMHNSTAFSKRKSLHLMSKISTLILCILCIAGAKFNAQAQCTTANWGTSPWNGGTSTAGVNLTNIVAGLNATVTVSKGAVVGTLDNPNVVVQSTPQISQNFNTFQLDPAAGFVSNTGTSFGFGAINDLAVYFNPAANQGTSPLTITLTFNQPVYNLSFLISDIDGDGVSPPTSGSRRDKVTVTSNAGNPVLSSNAGALSPTFNISGNSAQATSSAITTNNTTAGTINVTVPNGATTVTIVYEETSGASDPAMRGIGILGGLAVCKCSAAVNATTTAPVCIGSSFNLAATGNLSSYTWNPGNLVGANQTVTPTATTIYTVSGIDANGCSATSTVQAVVNPIPVVTVSGTSSICDGSSTTLTAAGASTYAWAAGG